jgi:linoleoyl-CoA desaturase
MIAALNHGVLITAALLQPGLAVTALLGAVLALGLATGTLTVLHDAGHRMFSRSAWPNVLAVQFSVPAGLWVGQWTLKHRVHHKLLQVYPIDESTRSSALLRLHREAPLRPMHRYQHVYAWGLYSLAWLGELRSQLTYLRTGVISGIETPRRARRVGSFAVEKLLWLLVLAPYVWRLGFGRMALILVVAMTLGSLIAAVVVAVGHINLGLVADPGPPGADWSEHVIRTTASFALDSRLARWWTGGMTHHLAHHLRPAAPRSQLPVLHATAVRQLVTRSGLTLSEYSSFTAAVLAHHSRLRELGAPTRSDL